MYPTGIQHHAVPKNFTIREINVSLHPNHIESCTGQKLQEHSYSFEKKEPLLPQLVQIHLREL